MSPRAVIWRFLAFKPPMSTIKLPAIRLVDMWTAMRRFAIYCYSLFTNVIPKLLHLAVRLQIGQRVYFTASNVAQRAEAPPATTLTSLFVTYQSDPFPNVALLRDATLLHLERFNEEISTPEAGRRGPWLSRLCVLLMLLAVFIELNRRMINASICCCCWWKFEGQHHSNHYELLMA